MEFKASIITDAGREMLAAANINDKIVFSKFMFEGADVTLTKNTTALTSPWGRGNVDNHFAKDSDLVIYASASNQYDCGYAYGFGIYGYLQSQGPSQEKLMFVGNHEGIATYVTSTSGNYTKFQIALTIKYSVDDAAVTIAPAYNGYVAADLFQRWSERVVTTHADGDEGTGDDQTIRGVKLFMDEIVLAGANGQVVTYASGEEDYTNIQYDDDKSASVFGAYYDAGSTQAFSGIEVRDGSANSVTLRSRKQLSGRVSECYVSVDADAQYGRNVKIYGQSDTYAILGNNHINVKAGNTSGIEIQDDAERECLSITSHGTKNIAFYPDQIEVYSTTATKKAIVPWLGNYESATLGTTSKYFYAAYITDMNATRVTCEESVETNRLETKSIACEGEVNAGVVVARSVQTTNFSVSSISTGTLMFGEIKSPLPHAVKSTVDVEGVWDTVDIPIGCITLAAFYIPTALTRVGQQFDVSESMANDTTPNTGICTASLPYKHTSSSRLRVFSRGKLGAGRYITMSEPIEDDDTYGMDNTTKVMVVLVQRIA